MQTRFPQGTYRAIQQCILKAKEDGFVFADTAIAELETLTGHPMSLSPPQPAPKGWSIIEA